MTSSATTLRRGKPGGDDRRKAIVAFFGEYTSEHGYPPTVREIGEAVGLVSPSSVAWHIKQLEIDGVFTHRASTPRSLARPRSTDMAGVCDPVDEADRCVACGGTGRAGAS
jgi:repressor LexA